MKTLQINQNENEQKKGKRHAQDAAEHTDRRSEQKIADCPRGSTDLARDLVGLRQSLANGGIILRQGVHAVADPFPNVRRVLNEAVDLIRQRRNGEEDNRPGDREQSEHDQSDRRHSRKAMSLQPDNDWIQDHRQEKHDREKQQDRLKRKQNEGEDNEEDQESDDSPGTAVA